MNWYLTEALTEIFCRPEIFSIIITAVNLKTIPSCSLRETLAAVMPANELEQGRILLSHQGSTFGGLVIGADFCDTSNYNWIFKELMEHFKSRGYERAELRMPHWLYARKDRGNELLDYYFQLNGFAMRGRLDFM